MKVYKPDVYWVIRTCPFCGEENKDCQEYTALPLCGGCDQWTAWDDIFVRPHQIEHIPAEKTDSQKLQEIKTYIQGVLAEPYTFSDHQNGMRIGYRKILEMIEGRHEK